MDPDLSIDDELQPRKSDTGMRQPGKSEGLVGGADIHHDLHWDVGHRSQIGALDSEIQKSVIDVAGITFGAGHGDQLTVDEFTGCSTSADHGRDAELPGDDGGMAGTTTAISDDGTGTLHDRLPIRVGHVSDQNLTPRKPVHVFD